MSKWTDEMINDLMDLYEDHSYDEIAEKISKKHRKVTANAARKAYERYQYPVIDDTKKEGPKVLILDIETAPLLARVWGTFKQNIGLSMVESDWHILSWAAKWWGEDEVIYQDQRNAKNIEDDKKLLKKIHKLMDEADIVVGHNGKGFDTKKLNARFILNGMEPPSSYRQFDTYLVAKRHFKFTSNKLEYLTDKLCKKYKKLKHGKFPGYELWKETLRDNPEAWNEMEEYNRYDVLSLEELFEIMLPWDDQINFMVYQDEEKCSCGSTEFKKNGKYYTNANVYQKYKCKGCGKEYRGKSPEKGKGSDFRNTNRRG